MTGNEWEAHIARENQDLHKQERAAVYRVPTHMYGGHPWSGPKVDYTGCVKGGRHVALEAKANSGTLTRKQRLLLAHTARMGGIAAVYRWKDGERHLCLVDGDGVMERKSTATLCRPGETWLDAYQRREE